MLTTTMEVRPTTQQITTPTTYQLPKEERRKIGASTPSHVAHSITTVSLARLMIIIWQLPVSLISSAIRRMENTSATLAPNMVSTARHVI